MAQKGRIDLGCDGDITIFDPETIIDKADFSKLAKPEGIEAVLLHGEFAIKDGKSVNERVGHFISFA